MAEILHQIARFLIPTWPLIAACLLALLPERRLPWSAYYFSVSGLVLAIVLTPFLTGQDVLSRWTCLLAATVPFLTLTASASRLVHCLPFLFSFVMLIALCTQTVLLAAGFTACAALILALEDTLTTMRARQAWGLMRVRLAGIMLTFLGSGLTSFSLAPATLRLGDLFLAIGLCLLIGLGNGTLTGSDNISDNRRISVLNTLLCISGIALMLRLPERDIIQLILSLCGIAGLLLWLLQRQEAPRFFVTLAILAATIPSGVFPALLLMTTGFALSVLPSSDQPTRRWLASGLPPWPGFPAVCSLLPGLFHTSLVATGLCLISLGVQASQIRFTWPDTRNWPNRLVLGCLLVLGVTSPFFLGSTLPLKWHAP